MNRSRLAWLFVILGGVIASAGVALLSIPLALIVIGVGIAALGLLAIEVTP
jgi:hypothetical protein